MTHFFEGNDRIVFGVLLSHPLKQEDVEKLQWLFGGAAAVAGDHIEGYFIGPRKEMVTPWSTNAVEITQNMGIAGITRIEEFLRVEDGNPPYDRMLQSLYQGLNQEVFTIAREPEPVIYIEDISAYNLKEGLALSPEEISYLENLSRRLNRSLTDSEVFGFSQVNSEHCRHKIFNGTFILDGKEMPESLFDMIKKTTKRFPNLVVSAYKDNVAFISGPKVEQFAPARQDVPDYFIINDIDTVLSLKAETHNFPTTVEPFNGAATGSGGEIRDRMAGGKGSLPLAGTAVYMTSYPRPGNGRAWERHPEPRPWLYHTPEEILIRASNGASDFGNKFGQPLICGSLLTFEHEEDNTVLGYDKVIMLAGGVGFAKKTDSLKGTPAAGDRLHVLGGDNYRIGMGGGAVSSVATGEFSNQIELNAVQRSNPEMQKRVYNAIRALAELEHNPVISIHDHGAGGHLNSLSELVDPAGGTIHIDSLPVGDATLSAKEIIGNESQERMGLVLQEKDAELLENIAARERAPLCQVGEVTGDGNLVFEDFAHHTRPIDLRLEDMFGKPPVTVLKDENLPHRYKDPAYDAGKITEYLEAVLQMEAVACKDWLTNKVDRSVTGKVARQQCQGPVQLPVSDLGIAALDYRGLCGVATSLGHAPAAGLIDPAAGSRLSVAEALTNIVWAPFPEGLSSISLSANWMWPARNKGEDARLYAAVKALSDFVIELGINVPTGKDSLSMTQKYPGGKVVYAPGTVIVSAAGEVEDIRKTVPQVIFPDTGSSLYHIDFSGTEPALGGSSLAQSLNSLGSECPDVADASAFRRAFNAVQSLIKKGMILAGHDISAGGLVTTLLEMFFPRNGWGMQADLSEMKGNDPVKQLFAENPGIVIQVKETGYVEEFLQKQGIPFTRIGRPVESGHFTIKTGAKVFDFEVAKLRETWFRTSWLLDRKQCGEVLAGKRSRNFTAQELHFVFSKNFSGSASDWGIDLQRRDKTGFRAAIIREKGVNGDREMAFMLYTAGFDVKDVHMTDLISGRETLDEINLIVFVGGFSNSDVLGSGKGWAGAFLYNRQAKAALEKFYRRPDTLSLGVCNGCQLMVELGLMDSENNCKPKLHVNASHKFESAFLSVDIPENRSVMLGSMAGSRLGIWVAHGEGRFELPLPEGHYPVAMKYTHTEYPGNPNGSDYAMAGLCSADGRHLAIMPHLERAFFPWQWAYYPEDRGRDEISPWMEAFVNAREWIRRQTT